MNPAVRLLCMTIAFMTWADRARAEEKDPRPAAAVQDNSFLIEEAYNQEAGVIQHINNWRRLDKNWFYTFTQEWPIITQTHQFSYTEPASAGLASNDNADAATVSANTTEVNLRISMSSLILRVPLMWKIHAPI